MQAVTDRASLTRKRIRRLYRKHPSWSIRQAATDLGVAPSTVWKALQDDPALHWAECECCGTLIVKVVEDAGPV